MNSTDDAIENLRSHGLTIANVQAVGLGATHTLIRATRRVFQDSFVYLYMRADPIAGPHAINMRLLMIAYLLMSSDRTQPAALIAAAERMLRSIETAAPTLQTDVRMYLMRMRPFIRVALAGRTRRALASALTARAQLEPYIAVAGVDNVMQSLDASIETIRRMLQ